MAFRINGDALSVLPDTQRSAPVVDPDDHHLFASLGCAVEDLVIAARAAGKVNEGSYGGSDGAIDIRLYPGAIEKSELFQAIPKRQSTRSPYRGGGVPLDVLQQSRSAASDRDVAVVFITDRAMIEQVLELIVAANRKQMADAALVQELMAWIRFNPAAALATGDGLFSASSANPSLPSWLGQIVFSQIFNDTTETPKLIAQVRSSAGLAVFLANEDSRVGWIKTGRVYERFALQATALGIRNAMLNQPVEVPEFRQQLAQLAGMPGKRPDLLMRFGYADLLPMSPRRRLTEVIA
ncbi:MAG: Acg family FMN-binding oxidoreductase [Beijerinckiaceae bacterium]